MKLCSCVLAAGGSERFGREKLLEILEGKPLILHSIKTASFLEDVILIVRSNLNLPKIPSSVDVVKNPGWKEGMASSVRICVKRAMEKGCDGVFVFLGDMPAISKECIDVVLKNLKKGKIIYPVRKGKKGFPTFISKEVFEEVLKLSGDVGVSSIIKEHKEWCFEVEVSSEGCFADVDNPKDLERIKEILKKGS